MAGRNQHHIPQFWQRGFGVPRSGKPKEIWEFTKDGEPELKLIKDVASGFDFYGRALDDKITEIETPLSRQVNAIRALSVGSSVEGAVAAEVVAHLAPRSSHLRHIFTKGMTGVIDGAAQVFGDEGNLKRLLGMDGDSPSEFFKTEMSKALQGEASLSAVPQPLLEQLAFRFTKENFDKVFGPQAAAMANLLPGLKSMAETKAKEGHNKALTGLLSENIRREELAHFTWTVESAPVEGAILPDCVALGVAPDGKVSPFMMTSRGELAAVVLPLSSSSLLIGRADGAALPDTTNINADAAACSHNFFLGGSNKTEFANLAASIGQRSMLVIDEAVESAIGEYRVPSREEDEIPEAQDPEPVTNPFGYEISFLGCADQATAERVSEVVRSVVNSLSQLIPLGRLDGITFASDFAAGLASVDVGVPGVSPPEGATFDDGVMVAMTFNVLRDGVVKSRVVLAGAVAHALLEVDETNSAWAVQLLVHELALVATTQWFDQAFPNFIFKPIRDPYESKAYLSANAALDGYIAARISSGLADQFVPDNYRNHLIAALGRAKVLILPERLAYRTHGDLAKFLDIAYPAAGQILQNAAKLLGHCDGQNSSPFDEAGELAQALEAHGLSGWLPTFRADLERLWRRRGHWKSIEEVFHLNRHTERVLWQYGIFAWRKSESEWRVEVPVATDELALLAGMAAGTIPIPDGFDPSQMGDPSAGA